MKLPELNSAGDFISNESGISNDLLSALFNHEAFQGEDIFEKFMQIFKQLDTEVQKQVNPDDIYRDYGLMAGDLELSEATIQMILLNLQQMYELNGSLTGEAHLIIALLDENHELHDFLNELYKEYLLKSENIDSEGRIDFSSDEMQHFLEDLDQVLTGKLDLNEVEVPASYKTANFSIDPRINSVLLKHLLGFPLSEEDHILILNCELLNTHYREYQEMYPLDQLVQGANSGEGFVIPKVPFPQVEQFPNEILITGGVLVLALIAFMFLIASAKKQ